MLNWKIAIRELAVSGCDYMEAFRYKRKGLLLKSLLLGDKKLVNRLINECEDIITASSLEELAGKMQDLSLDGVGFDAEGMQVDIRAYDACIERGPSYFNRRATAPHRRLPTLQRRPHASVRSHSAK